MEINPAVNFQHDRKVMHARRPKVLIVGAGLGGLTLGAILQKTDIPYEIFERAAVVKPLGSGITLNATVAPLMRQLGIYDEFVAMSNVVPAVQVGNENREIQFSFSNYFDEATTKFGADTRLLARPKLYELFLRQVPTERIHMSKKILSTTQGGNGVLIRCSDGTEYEGDILVGADGAHSAIRQTLYEQLKKDRKLPSSDDVPLPFSTICLVGQTKPLTPEDIPLLAADKCQIVRIVGEDKPYAWNTFTTTQSTVCWSIVRFLDEESSKMNDSFRNSEWGPEAAEAMCEEVRNFPIIAGGDKKLTIGDLIDWSPKEYISKVMLEEKVFKTWHGCRTVLMGDACHKLNPSGGAGAVNAMHDAAVLANYINALPLHPVVDEIESAFESYRDERIEWVERAFNTSQMLQALVAKGLKPMLVRFMMKNMPEFLKRRAAEQMYSCRPQLAFLPLDETPALVKPAYQPSLKAKAPAQEVNDQEQPAQSV
ncbi:hypothetical protein EC957_006729 [Mortierella hygrophila]|uniref:FAD-binding domain-containing protein n=1 Tax=Mortierella hygrophila TaxID=979708 RepID=A0A9P6JYZ1_9FUNG|nr:hypothetical protein EC957_006729 [Mortierella hygrophila]